MNRTDRLKTAAALAIFIITLLVGGCSEEKSEEKRPIRIGIDVFPGWAHAFIAREKGFFKDNGVDVELVFSEDYRVIKEQFGDNELDGAFMVYADAVYANNQGLDVKVVYISDISITGDVIVGRPGLSGLEDLKGKTVGVEGVNTFSHIFVLAVLEKAGLGEMDFFVKNIDAQDVADAIDKGLIDAGHTYGPGKARAKEKGFSFLAYAGDVEGLVTDILVFREKIIRERPEEIKAIVKSLFEAKRFQETDREEAVKIIAKIISDTPGSVAIGIDAVRYYDEEENIHMMCKEEEEKSGEVFSLIESGRIISDFYLKRGQLSFVRDIHDIIEPRFVKELAAERREGK